MPISAYGWMRASDLEERDPSLRGILQHHGYMGHLSGLLAGHLCYGRMRCAVRLRMFLAPIVGFLAGRRGISAGSLLCRSGTGFRFLARSENTKMGIRTDRLTPSEVS